MPLFKICELGFDCVDTIECFVTLPSSRVLWRSFPRLNRQYIAFDLCRNCWRGEFESLRKFEAFEMQSARIDLHGKPTQSEHPSLIKFEVSMIFPLLFSGRDEKSRGNPFKHSTSGQGNKDVDDVYRIELKRRSNEFQFAISNKLAESLKLKSHHRKEASRKISAEQAILFKRCENKMSAVAIVSSFVVSCMGVLSNGSIIILVILTKQVRSRDSARWPIISYSWRTSRLSIRHEGASREFI